MEASILKLDDNWKLMPCGLTEFAAGFETQRHHLRAIRPKGIPELRKLPVRNYVFRREDYMTDGEFRGAIERKVIELNMGGYNVYQNAQEINDDFAGNVVSDKDIFSYDNLFIDLDRAGHHKEPATDEEIARIEVVADNIIRFLTKLGWPKPIKVLSGNGYHMYYKLDGWVSGTENKELIRQALHCLGDKFDDAHTQVDRSVHNPSQITKVIGTIARKGKASIDRPHRTVTLIYSPSTWYYVTGEMVLDLLKYHGKPPKQKVPSVDNNLQSEFPDLVAKLDPELNLTADKYNTPETPREVARIKEMLTFIDANCDRQTWRDISWAILSTGFSCAEALAREWSMTAPEAWNEAEFNTLVSSYDPQLESGHTLGTVVHFSRLGGWEG